MNKPDLKNIWPLHYDNAELHTAFIVKEFFWKKEKLKFLHTLHTVPTLPHVIFGFLEP